MADISLRDVAKYYNEKQHQNDALDFLQDHTSPGVLAKFADLWRSGPKQSPVRLSHQVTGSMLAKLTGHDEEAFDYVFLDDMQALFDATGFNENLTARQMLVAQMAHESAGFVYMKEIASGNAYDYRTDLGNRGPNDGSTYKGAGVSPTWEAYTNARFGIGALFDQSN